MSINFEREGRTEPQQMPEGKDTFSAWKSKGIGHKTKRILSNMDTLNAFDATTDSFAFDMRLFSTVLLHIKNIGANSITYQVIACLDPSIWEVIVSPTALATNTSTKQTITEKWNYVKVQIRATVGGSQGKVNAFANGKNP